MLNKKTSDTEVRSIDSTLNIQNSTFNIAFLLYSILRANCTLGSCVVLSVVAP